MTIKFGKRWESGDWVYKDWSIWSSMTLWKHKKRPRKISRKPSKVIRRRRRVLQQPLGTCWVLWGLEGSASSKDHSLEETIMIVIWTVQVLQSLRAPDLELHLMQEILQGIKDQIRMQKRGNSHNLQEVTCHLLLKLNHRQWKSPKSWLRTSFSTPWVSSSTTLWT